MIPKAIATFALAIVKQIPSVNCKIALSRTNKATALIMVKNALVIIWFVFFFFLKFMYMSSV